MSFCHKNGDRVPQVTALYRKCYQESAIHSLVSQQHDQCSQAIISKQEDAITVKYITLTSSQAVYSKMQPPVPYRIFVTMFLVIHQKE